MSNTLSPEYTSPESQQHVIYVERAPEPKNGLAIFALIVAVVGLGFSLIPFTFFVALGAGFLALLLGFVAWRRTRKGRATNVKTAITAMVAGFLAVVMGIVGAVTLFNAVDDAVNDIDKSLAAEAKNDKPVAVQEGAAFTHDGYKVAAGWSIASQQYSGLTIKHLKVTNVDHGTDTGDIPMLTFSLWKGSENLAQIEASGNELAKGETTKMDAYSDSNLQRVPAFSTIKVADAF